MVFVSVDEIVPLAAIATLVPAVRAATTLVVSVTSADASMPSNLVPSADTLRPSKVEFVVIAPVIAPPVLGSFSPSDVAVVVAKLASSPNAAANSFNVLSASGEESTMLATAVSV